MKIKISYKPIQEIGNGRIDGIRDLRKRELIQTVVRAVNHWMYLSDKEEDFQDHRRIASAVRQPGIDLLR